MNVAALIIALVGAGLNLFQPVTSAPMSALGFSASMLDTFLFFFNLISEKTIKDTGFIAMFLIVTLLIIVPVQAVKNGIYALQRTKDKNPVRGLIECAVVNVIFALIIYFMPHLLSPDAESRFFMQYGMNSFISFTTPLIWAACYAVAALFANEALKEPEEKTIVATPAPVLQAPQPVKTFEPIIGVETPALIKRGNLFLDEGNFDEAERYFEQALRQDPENSKAYLGKLMAELKAHNIDELSGTSVSLQEHKLFQRAMQFASKEEKVSLENLLKDSEDKSLEDKYASAIDQMKAMETTNTSYQILNLARSFDALGDYKDAKAIAEELRCKEQEMRYAYAINQKKMLETTAASYQIRDLARSFDALGDYKDAKVIAEELRDKAKKVDEENSRKEAERKEQERLQAERRNKRMKIIAIVIAGAAICYIGVSWYQKYAAAQRAEEERIARIEAEKQEEKSRIDALKRELQGQK